MPDTVPMQIDTTQQQNQAAQGNQILLSLVQQRDNAQTAYNQAAKDALVPVSSGPTPSSPQLALPSVPQFQPQPMNNRQVVGAKNAKWQGISNLVTGTTNAIGQYEQKKNQEKQRVMAVDIERVLQANDGINQAQQILKQDPTNKEANETLAKNQNILNSILSDDKRRKMLAKAFDISFTDPAKNNQPEHMAMKDALNNYSKQFREQMPQQLVPNQQAINKAQMAQSNVKAIDSAIKDIVRIVNQENKDKQQSLNNDAKIQQQELKDKDALDRQTQRDKDKAIEDDKKLKASVDKATMSFQHAIQVAQLHGNYQLQKASIEAATKIKGIKMQLDSAEKIVKLKGYTGQQAANVYMRSLDGINREEQNIPKQIIYWESIAKTANPQDKQTIEAHIGQLYAQQELISVEKKQRQDEIDAALKQGNNVNNTATSTTNQGKPSTTNTDPNKPDVNPDDY